MDNSFTMVSKKIVLTFLRLILAESGTPDSACLDTDFLVTEKRFGGWNPSQGSQNVFHNKDIIKFHNNYIEGKVVSKQAEKVSKLAEFAAHWKTCLFLRRPISISHFGNMKK